MKHWTGWIIVALAVVVGGWMIFDGTRAIVLGDYVTPSSGEYAGQLGPWAQILTAVGVEPRSSLAKTLHILLGSIFVVSSFTLLRQTFWSWAAALMASMLVLWYVPFGTAAGLVSVILLVSPGMKWNLKRHAG